MEPQIRFCTSADATRISYAVYGDEQATPIVQVNSWLGCHELRWGQSVFRSHIESLARGRQVIGIDRRGVGASARDVDDLSMDAQVSDLAAVVDHLGLEQFDLAGWIDGAAVSVAYAAQRPERLLRLVLNAVYPRGEDAWNPKFVHSLLDLIDTNWSMARRMLADVLFPDGSAEQRRAQAAAFRDVVSPATAAKYVEFMSGVDIRPFLPRVQAPTLVLHQPGASAAMIAASREVATQIPDARFVVSESGGPLLSMGETARFIRQFLDEGRAAPTKDAILSQGTAIILFIDIVDSTAITSRLGDAAYRDKERELDAALRAAITAAAGTPIEGKVLGDGVMAVFTSARQAIDCALRCRTLGADAGLPLHLGIHAGDVVREGNNVHGGAVQLAARIAGVSEPGEILVSDTLRGLARTSTDVAFKDRGEHEMKGIPEPQRLFAVRANGSPSEGSP